MSRRDAEISSHRPTRRVGEGASGRVGEVCNLPLPLSPSLPLFQSWPFRAFAQVLLVVITLAAMAHAAEPAAERPLTYSRYFVPEDQPKDWPRRNIKYIPWDKDDFERLVEAANAVPLGRSTSIAAQVISAVYRASLLEPDVLRGEARLETVRTSGRTVLMPLEPFNIALSAARWDDDNEPATFGVLPSGKQAVLVDRDATLILNWSFRGRREQDGATVFNLELPASPLNRLEVEAPTTAAPAISDGVRVSEVDEQRRGKWLFELGGHTKVALKLGSKDANPRSQSLVLLQERTNYRISPAGLYVEAQLKLDVHGEPLRHLQLDPQPPLRIVSVQSGGIELPWSAAGSADTGVNVAIDSPEPLLGPARMVTVTALAPIDMEKAWRLPRVRVRDVTWQEGDIMLTVGGLLTLDALLPIGCRQTKVGPGIELQLFSAEATAQVQVSRRQQRAMLTSGATVRLASDLMRAEFRGKFESIEGETFLLHADVGAGWQIESLTADRPGILANWSVDRTLRPNALVVHLKEPITASRPLELLVAARHAAPANLHFSSSLLQVLDFRGIDNNRRLMALETSGNQRLSLAGNDRPRFQPRTDLTDLERGLLASALSDVFLEASPDHTDWQVVVHQQPPRYDADLKVVAKVIAGGLNESYRIHCKPDASRVDRVLLAFSQRRNDDLHVNLEGVDGTVDAQRLSSQEQAARGLSDAGEVWRVELPQAMEQPFTVLAGRSTTFAGEAAPALVSLPDATSQQGLVEIEFEQEPLLINSADRLEPLASNSADDASRQNRRTAFRYDPLNEFAQVLPAAISVRRASSEGEPALASVWRMTLQSHYESSGRSRHRTVLHIENSGQRDCTFRIPGKAEFVKATVDGKVLVVSPDGDELRLGLPDDRRFTVITVDMASTGPPMGLLSRCPLPWPAVDLPVMSREWFVSMATEYEPLAWPQGGSWAAAILGLFGRHDGERPFDAILAADWRRLVRATSPQRLANEHADRFLSVLGSTVCNRSRSISTLGRLLSETSAAEPSLRDTLMIDAQALAAIDKWPSSPLFDDALRTAEAGKADGVLRDFAAQVLRWHQLAVLCQGDRLVLTSRPRAVAAACKTFDDGRSLVFSQPSTNPRVAPPSTIEYLPVGAWLQYSDRGWPRGRSASDGEFYEAVSNLYQIEPADDKETVLHLVRRDVMIAAAVALAAVCGAAGLGLARWQSVLLPLSVAASAVAAIWLPAALLPLARGAVVGFMAAALWRLAQPVNRFSRPHKKWPAKRPNAASTALGLLVLLMLFPHAQADDMPQPAPVYRVFIPVDAENKPGTTYHVPSDFLDELRRRANLAAAEPRGWLVTAANYECTLTGDDRIGVSGFKARYDLQVFSADTRISIPASRRRSVLIVDSALLDGRPIDLDWDDEGEVLNCDVVEPGRYSLEFRLEPVVDDDADTSGFRMVVPQVAASTLDVVLPPKLDTVTVPGALGETTISDEGRRISARLGPIGAVVVRWPTAMPAATEADVEELLWLKVGPGSVVLDVTLNFNLTRGALRQIEFAADRRLRLLPDSHFLRERTLPADTDAPNASQITQLELDRPVTDPFSQRLSFFLSGTSGVGNIHLPHFRTLNGRLVRRWLAVSVDSGLEYETRDAEQLNILPAADFAAKWGDADPSLHDALVYRLGPADTTWSLATRSREPQTTVKEVLALSFQPSSALVRYDAQLMTTAGFVFQHRLTVPPELQIERVKLEEDGVNRVARWARPEPGAVTLFLNRRVTGPQQLSVWGRLPVRANGRLSLPVVTLDPGQSAAGIERAAILERRIHLYRQPSAVVSLEDEVGLSQQVQAAPEQMSASFGRLVLSRTTDKVYSGTVKVAANAPSVSEAVQLTQLRYVNQSWIAEIDCRFHVERGLLDSMSFDAPSAWASNVEVLSPPGVLELSDLPGKSRKVLSVTPLIPFSGDCQLRLRAPLKYTPGESVSVPEIVPLELPVAERYWLLPRQVGIESVNWDVQRLVGASLPESANVSTDGMAVYRAVGDRPQAVMSAVQPAVGLARVRLADVSFDFRPAWGWLAATALDIEPGGNSTCPVKLAASWRLLNVRVGGKAVVPLPKAKGDWEVPLQSDRLPQRLELTLALDVQSASATLPLPVLQVDGWPVEETLLTVYSPKSYRVETEARKVSPIECDTTRMAIAASLIDLPEEIAVTTSNDNLTAWFRPWAQWLVCCGRRAARQKAVNTETASSRPPATSLPDEWRTVARRLGVEDVLTTIAQRQPPATDTLEMWQTVHDSSPTAHFRWASTTGPKELVLRHFWSADWFGRTYISAGMMFAALCTITLARVAAVADLVRRWPWLVGVAIGILWWLYGEPSVLGWVLIVVCLIASLRSAFRTISP